MASSVLQQYTISDFIEWDRKKTLTLNPYFQRRSVWSPAAKTYLIDTILREMPMPKLYLRTVIDPRTQKALREVVDGQQRLRSILDFAAGKFALSNRAAEFEGLTFEDLSDEQKTQFLSYTLGVDQLINASDSDVLEVFARLNSYTVSLNAAEKRHAKYQGEFKWAVHESARKWVVFWEKYRVISVADRVRMADDALVAEFYGFLLEGLQEGGEQSLNRLYLKMDPSFENQKAITGRLDRTFRRIDSELGDALSGPIAKRPHFTMLFAAVAHATVGLPKGLMGASMPRRENAALTDPAIAVDNLNALGEVIELDDPPAAAVARKFWVASKATTQRATSRTARFPTYYRALLPKRLAL